MKKIILFIPFYGSFPSYFFTWLKTTVHLDSFIDFVIFTDKLPNASSLDFLAGNVRFVSLPFKELQARFKTFCGAAPMHPYKLCDYKPLYGKAFSDYVTDEYSYWGYCDVDTLLGDVKGFLERIEYTKYDRVGEKGHFTIYRNNEMTKNLFQEKIQGSSKAYNDFDYVQQTTYACHFDEEGMNEICHYKGLSFYEFKQYFNTVEAAVHIHTSQRMKEHELLTWENGHAYHYFYQEGKVAREEGMYIHFQYQKNMPELDDFKGSILVTPQGFAHFESSSLSHYLQTIGRPDTPEESAQVRMEYVKKLRRGRREKLLRELKYNGPSALKNIILRVPSLLRLIKYKNL